MRILKTAIVPMRHQMPPARPRLIAGMTRGIPIIKTSVPIQAPPGTARLSLGTQTQAQTRKISTTRTAERYASISVPTETLLESLRDMVSYRTLTPNTSISPFLLRKESSDYRSALRAIAALALSGEDAAMRKDTLTIKELEGVLSPENGVTWRLVHELVNYGFSTELESLDEEKRAAVRFNRVHGFGKIKALELAQNGARTLDDLLHSEGKEFGRKINDAQKLAIVHHRDMERMIPRKEVEEFRKLIDQALKKAHPTLNFEIMGSFRRRDEVSSDIDMVVWHDSFRHRDRDEKRSKKGVRSDSLMGKVLKALGDADLLDPSKFFAEGEKKCLALTRLPSSTCGPYRQIDIRLCPTESLHYMLLGNTGDDGLMKVLRWRAMEKGWVLNEYGMGPREGDETSTWVKEGQEIIVNSEKEIFDKLGVPYLEPRQRSYKTYKDILPKKWDL